MKILNLYAGVGGNRKLWPNGNKIAAVEIKKDIAEVYKKLFPNDEIIIDDAHKFLLEHFNEYDFIWSSPPCQSHSGTNYYLFPQGVKRYPDVKLYEEILFLQNWCKSKWVVENVKPYYEPLIKPQICGRHYFWSNFEITNIPIKYDVGTHNREASKCSQRKAIIREAQIPELIDLHRINLLDIKLRNKRQILRNTVLPEIGLHVYNCAFKIKQEKIVS